jgi:hypothetical protein
MKPTALHIERWLSNLEARLVPPERKCLQIIIHELCEGESREKAFAELVARYPQNVAGKTVDDLNWSDDLVGVQEKAVAEHIAAHPEDAGRTVKDFRWVVWEIVRKPQELPQELFEDELTAKDTDEDAAVSETDLNVLTPPDPDYLARSKPWRPVHQRPARDMRRPTWKKWER